MRECVSAWGLHKLREILREISSVGPVQKNCEKSSVQLAAGQIFFGVSSKFSLVMQYNNNKKHFAPQTNNRHEPTNTPRRMSALRRSSSFPPNQRRVAGQLRSAHTRPPPPAAHIYRRAAPSLFALLRPPRCSCWCSGWRSQSGPHRRRRRGRQHPMLLRLRRH